MGGLVSNSYDGLTKELWTYCVERNSWLSTIHIPGKKMIKQTICPDCLMKMLNGN